MQAQRFIEVLYLLAAGFLLLALVVGYQHMQPQQRWLYVAALVLMVALYSFRRQQRIRNQRRPPSQ